MKYSEAENFGNSYRAEYRKSINDFVAKLREDRRAESVKNAKRFVNNGNEERAALSRAIGLSFLENYSDEIQAKCEKVTECNGIIIYRVTLNVLTDIRYYGLLFIHDSDKKRPFVICQHGGDGTPELCSSLLENGSSNYNDMTMRVLSLGVNVFAPQMLLWNPERFDNIPGKNLHRVELDLQLKQCGSSIAALEIFCLQKSLDYFCKMPTVDSNKIGMVGLSYGGFYTLYTAALDTRIKAAVSCSFFNDRGRYSWSDWVWNPGEHFFFDPEVAMLVYPRSLCIAVGKSDELFKIDTANSEIERLSIMSNNAYGNTEWFTAINYDGAHEFIPTNNALKWFINKLVND